MDEPSPRGSRMALAGAVIAALVVGGGGFMLGRSTLERDPETIAAPAAQPTPLAEPEPIEASVLGRARLLELATAAADVAAGGRAHPELAKAEGRRFELRLPFGCDGPADAGSASDLRWRYDQASGSLRIHIAPALWPAGDWWPSDDPTHIESIQGFWVDRPWTSSEACPAKADAAAGSGIKPPLRTLALGQIFGAEASRAGRRDGQPYEAIVRIPQEELDTSKGFRMRISGRIAPIKDTGPVHCRQSPDPSNPPVCLLSVVMDEIAVENAADGETLATWDLRGSASAPV